MLHVLSKFKVKYLTKTVYLFQPSFTIIKKISSMIPIFLETMPV